MTPFDAAAAAVCLSSPHLPQPTLGANDADGEIA